MKPGKTEERVLTFPEALELREKLRQEGRKVVLTNGCFDILHRGHIEYLGQSAELGDVLIVAVNSDASVRELKGPSRPVNNEQDRAYALASLRPVDATFVFAGPRLAGEIRELKPDIYAKAGDYTLETLEASEYAALVEVGTEIRFLPFVAGHSTTGILGKLA